MKFRKLPVVIDAWQWHSHGDHEKVVPCSNVHTDLLCEDCGIILSDHGWIKTLEGGHIVCPGDWIIKGVMDEFYPCKKEVFDLTYESVEDVK